MNLNKAKIRLEHFVVISEYGFIENNETVLNENELTLLYNETFKFFENYCIEKYNDSLLNIRTKRNTIHLELKNGKTKVIKK
ncbi:hypothetical protein Terranova_053 [Staphylococcus phage Terranova]|nr:hypothetical protein Terranova_053 [Staphylococcus phage Terranova]